MCVQDRGNPHVLRAPSLSRSSWNQATSMLLALGALLHKSGVLLQPSVEVSDPQTGGCNKYKEVTDKISLYLIPAGGT